jgi:hypothetical protein
MRQFPKSIAAIAMATALLLATSGSAFATVYKDGTLTCTTNYTMQIHSYATGSVEHHFPAPYYDVDYFTNGATWTMRASYDAGPGGHGYWWAQTDGSLNDPYTYAQCVRTGG